MESCDKRKLGSVARLQEFYSNALLHRFYHKFEEFDMDVIEGFAFAEKELMNALNSGEQPPCFKEIGNKFIEERTKTITTQT